MGRESESIFYFWKVYEINSQNLEVKSFVSIMKSKMKNCMMEAQRNLKRENYKCSLLWLSKGLVFYPNHPECLIMRSTIYKQLKNLPLAVQDLDNAKKYIKNQNYKEKISKIICMTYNELALTMIKENFLSEATRLLNEAINYTPKNKHLYLNRGDCYLKAKDYNKAYKDYLHAYNLDSNNQEIKGRISTILFKYGIMCFNNKDFLEAMNYLIKALEYSPLCCEYLLLLSKCWIKLKNSHNAILSLEKALQINPEHKECILLLNSIKKF